MKKNLMFFAVLAAVVFLCLPACDSGSGTNAEYIIDPTPSPAPPIPPTSDVGSIPPPTDLQLLEGSETEEGFTVHFAPPVSAGTASYGYELSLNASAIYDGGNPDTLPTVVVSDYAGSDSTLLGRKQAVITGLKSGSIYNAFVRAASGKMKRSLWINLDPAPMVSGTTTVPTDGSPFTPPTDPNDPYYTGYNLAALEVYYPSDDSKANNLLTGFSPNSTNYSFEAGLNKTQVTFWPRTEYPLATTTITTPAGTFSTGMPITVPSGKSLDITITVFAEDGIHTKPYTVTVNSYSANHKIFGGTITGKGAYTPTKVILTNSVTNGNPQSINVETGNPTVWAGGVPLTFTPASFVVELVDSNGKTYQARAIANTFGSAGKQDIELALDGIGLAVFNPVEMQAIAGTGNYTLANDIDLSQGWSPPTIFSGKLFGNGHTVKNLILDKPDGDTGMFRSLDIGALISDVTIEASTAAGFQLNGSNHFGAIVGFINTTTTGGITFDNVTVRGKLDLGAVDNGYLLVGGLVGEVYNNSKATVLIKNCVSDLDIIANLGNHSDNYRSFGGFIGRAESTSVTIQNCYSTGDIDIATANNTGTLFAGGIIAWVNHDVSNIVIDNCYASGKMKVTRAGGTVYVGGLVGHYGTTNAASFIKNSAALNSAVYGGTANANVNRIAGYVANTSRLSNNIALTSMLVGSASVSGGALNDINGLDKAANAINAALFTSTLNWDGTAVWDLSGVNGASNPPRYPVLRQK
ncbi:hypothetical protein AGMMS50212_14290 [Spirochaetia bacterium]|nr:hypothetical protein AGMMS50212_14290 [Spirochaetia bacterium]